MKEKETLPVATKINESEFNLLWVTAKNYWVDKYNQFLDTIHKATMGANQCHNSVLILDAMLQEAEEAKSLGLKVEYYKDNEGQIFTAISEKPHMGFYIRK